MTDTEAILKLHNDYRSKHNSPPLQWDKNLASLALVRANVLVATGQLQHGDLVDQSNRRVGQNLAYTTTSPDDIVRAVRLWYNEASQYNFHRPGFAPATAHFTQLVWKSSTHVGAAVVRDPRTKRTYVVTNYFPPGNVAGHFPENVKALSGA